MPRQDKILKRRLEELEINRGHHELTAGHWRFESSVSQCLACRQMKVFEPRCEAWQYATHIGAPMFQCCGLATQSTSRNG